MDSVVHFEVVADDVQRAHKFYKDVFGWKFNEIPHMNYSTIETTPTDKDHMVLKPGAINGGMFVKTDDAKQTLIVVSVTNIDESIVKVKQAGGSITFNKIEIPGIGFYARIRDTEGNVVGLIQPIN